MNGTGQDLALQMKLLAGQASTYTRVGFISPNIFSLIPAGR